MYQVITFITLPIIEDTKLVSSCGRPRMRDSVHVDISSLVNIIVIKLYRVLLGELCTTLGTTMSLDSVPTCYVYKNYIT